MIETVKRVVCDHCGASSTAALESEDPITVAREDGWAVCSDLGGGVGVFRYEGGKDLCPGCQAINKPCKACGRTDLPLHVNEQCPECYVPA